MHVDGGILTFNRCVHLRCGGEPIRRQKSPRSVPSPGSGRFSTPTALYATMKEEKERRTRHKLGSTGSRRTQAMAAQSPWFRRRGLTGSSVDDVLGPLEKSSETCLGLTIFSLVRAGVRFSHHFTRRYLTSHILSWFRSYVRPFFSCSAWFLRWWTNRLQ